MNLFANIINKNENPTSQQSHCSSVKISKMVIMFREAFDDT